MKLRSALLSLALACTATAAFSAADPNSFLILKANQPIGKASYSIDTVKDGFHVRSHYTYHLPASNPSAMPTEYQITADYKVDPTGNYSSGYTTNVANQMITSFQPSKARDGVTIGQMQGGISLPSHVLAISRPDFMIGPDYDPSILQIFLTTALAHPHTDSRYPLLVPASAANGLVNLGGTKLYFVQIIPESDSTGTLDGKPLSLKHYQVSYMVGKADLYVDEKGNLMQADMGPLGVSYVRLKFIMDAK